MTRLSSTEEFIFYPPRRAGALFMLGLILVMIGGAAFGLYWASQAQIGPIFVLSLLPAMLAVVLVPFLSYRLYCLQASTYILERDGMRLRWGLRVEHIPMSDILWVSPIDEYRGMLPLPVFRIPGAVVGVRQIHPTLQPDAPRSVEFMASQTRNLILIAVAERIFAISPGDPASFLYDYQRLTELGSLTPLAGRSVYPTFLLGRVWRALPARLLLVASLALSLILTIWVLLAIPTHVQVHLGFYPDGSPGDLTPAIQLLLLPVLNGILVLFDLVAGLFFFRREETQNLSYLLWGTGALAPLLFLIGVFFILQSS